MGFVSGRPLDFFVPYTYARRHFGYGIKKSMCVLHDKDPFASLLLSGDINMNPGPPKYPCGICKKGVKGKKDAICCDGCGTWFHVRR